MFEKFSKVWARIKKFGVWKTALLIVVIPNVIYWGVVRPIQVRLEYRQFQQAEQEIEKLSQDLETITGTPDHSVLTKNCGRSEQKYTKGPRICTVSKQLSFKGFSPESSTDLMHKLSSLSASSLRVGSGASDPALIFKKPTSYPQVYYQKVESDSSLNCTFGHHYLQDGEFRVSVSCNKTAIAEYYPASN